MIIPDTMTAIEIVTPGGPEVLTPVIRPVPKPTANEVLIQVAAAGVNRPDCIQRTGSYPPPPGASDIPGLEIAGTIVAFGPNGTEPEEQINLAIGDHVTALVTGGGYAEYCTASAALCLPIPKNLDLVQAAALPETCFTVWSNVFDRANLTKGERFLIHGGSSGIGTIAIQIAAQFGARVFTTAGSDEKCRICESLGAERAINYRDQDWLAIIKDNSIGGVEVILDMVGGSYVSQNLRALNPDGRLIQIAWLQGSKIELDLMPIMLKRLVVTGSTLRTRSVAFKAAIAKELRQHVWPLLEAGTIQPLIHTRLPLAEAATAHTLMESSTHIGKIMLEI